MCCIVVTVCIFFNDTATTDIYTYVHTLSLHDALPISSRSAPRSAPPTLSSHYNLPVAHLVAHHPLWPTRSEEHTSELQSLMRTSYAVFCLKQQSVFLCD